MNQKILQVISRDFVTLWEPRYDTVRYPQDFYLRHSDSARNAEQPEQLKDHLLALLHWKDGKARAFVSGEVHAKPNTLNPILELAPCGLTDLARSFHSLAQAEEKDLTTSTESLRNKLSAMWKTVVVPAFLLHLARPGRLPIIDQHTVRAYLALTRGEVLEKPTISWNLWRDYVNFFQDAVAASGFDHDSAQRLYVDRALFAWGKSLKNALKRNIVIREPPGSPVSSGNPVLWGQQVPKTGIVPPSCNVLKAVEEYLGLGSLDSLPQYKKQNLRDLKFHKLALSRLRELLEERGGKVARQLLQDYKEEMDGGVDVGALPRPLLNVFLVGWAKICGIRGTTQSAIHLHKSGFGGTENAAKAVVNVGKTTGRLFGLLDDSGTPTGLFHEYFGAK